MFLSDSYKLFNEDNNLVEIKQLYSFNIQEYKNKFHNPCLRFFKNPNKNFILYKNINRLENTPPINSLNSFSNNIVTIVKSQKVITNNLENIYKKFEKQDDDFGDMYEYIRHCLEDISEYEEYMDGNKSIMYKGIPMKYIVKIHRFTSTIEDFVENTLDNNTRYLKNLLEHNHEDHIKQKALEDKKKRMAERRKHGKFINFLDFLGDPVQYAQDEWMD